MVDILKKMCYTTKAKYVRKIMALSSSGAAAPSHGVNSGSREERSDDTFREASACGVSEIPERDENKNRLTTGPIV